MQVNMKHGDKWNRDWICFPTITVILWQLRLHPVTITIYHSISIPVCSYFISHGTSHAKLVDPCLQVALNTRHIGSSTPAVHTKILAYNIASLTRLSSHHADHKGVCWIRRIILWCLPDSLSASAFCYTPKCLLPNEKAAKRKVSFEATYGILNVCSF